MPICATNVATVRTTAAINNNTKKAALSYVIRPSKYDLESDLHEPNNSNHLDDREDKLGLTKTLHSEKVNGDDGNQKDCNKYRMIQVMVPEINSNRSSNNLKRQTNQP